MSVPPDRPADEPADDTRGSDGSAPLDFDPYRFGKPDHPIPPEYAPPGYVPPEPAQPVAPPPPPYATGPQPGGYQPPPIYQPAPTRGDWPPTPPPYGYGVQPAPPAPRRSTGKATAALVLGIASIVLCFTSFFDIVPIVLAFVFGFIALAESKRSPYREGRGMALAGIWCAVVGTVLALVVSVLAVRLYQDCKQYDSGSSAYSDCVRDHI